jgi:hypothetical protein
MRSAKRKGISIFRAPLRADQKRISIIIYEGDNDEDGGNPIEGENIRNQNKGGEKK